MDPPPPAAVQEAARGLAFRDFLTVALVVPEADGFPDNWISVHSPDVRLGRIQKLRAVVTRAREGGPHLPRPRVLRLPGRRSLARSRRRARGARKQELATLGLVDPDRVEAGYVVRMPKAYPVYDKGYQERVEVLRDWLGTNAPNVYPVGRNGMHRYNNQDHSMLTAMLVVESIVDGTRHDVWEVNVEAEYHEEKAAADDPGAGGTAGTGRSAPVLPRRREVPSTTG